MEGIKFGISIIAVPMHLDQPTACNASGGDRRRCGSCEKQAR